MYMHIYACVLATEASVAFALHAAGKSKRNVTYTPRGRGANMQAADAVKDADKDTSC